MRVLHLIPTLGHGGAQRMITALAQADQKNEHIVAYWFGRPAYDTDGFEARSLGMSGRVGIWQALKLFVETLRLIRRVKPDRLAGWLYYGALASSLGWLFGLRPIWSLHATALQTQSRPLHLRLAIRLCALASRVIVPKIHYVSEESRLFHRALGFSSMADAVIVNGVSAVIFRPDVEERGEMRTALALSCKIDKSGSSLPWIGCIARFDPQKDHGCMLSAFETLYRENFPAHLFLIGPGCVSENEKLDGMIKAHGLEEVCHLLGERSDMPALYQAFDLVALSSLYGESFPLVLVEALACGVRVVATDVGASGEIVDGHGAIVPPGQPDALAVALASELQTPRSPEILHAYIEQNFGLERFSQAFLEFALNDR